VKLSYQTLHKQLSDVIGVLNHKIDDVIEKQELDFLSAYRVNYIFLIYFHVETHAEGLERP